MSVRDELSTDQLEDTSSDRTYVVAPRMSVAKGHETPSLSRTHPPISLRESPVHSMGWFSFPTVHSPPTCVVC